MAPVLPWLRQGDVFEDVPWSRLTLVERSLTTPRESGAALLITDNCQMDKRTGSGKIRPTLRLQFLPLRDLGELNPDTQSRLRNGDVAPPEAVFVGAYDGVELVGLLGEAYSIPWQYFDAETTDFSGHPDADEDDPFHLVIRDAERLMTMDEDRITLMHKKMWLYWTRLVPDD